MLVVAILADNAVTLAALALNEVATLPLKSPVTYATDCDKLNKEKLT